MGVGGWALGWFFVCLCVCGCWVAVCVGVGWESGLFSESKLSVFCWKFYLKYRKCFLLVQLGMSEWLLDMIRNCVGFACASSNLIIHIYLIFFPSSFFILTGKA